MNNEQLQQLLEVLTLIQTSLDKPDYSGIWSALLTAGIAAAVSIQVANGSIQAERNKDYCLEAMKVELDKSERMINLLYENKASFVKAQGFLGELKRAFSRTTDENRAQRIREVMELIDEIKDCIIRIRTLDIYLDDDLKKKIAEYHSAFDEFLIEYVQVLFRGVEYEEISKFFCQLGELNVSANDIIIALKNSIQMTMLELKEKGRKKWII